MRVEKRAWEVGEGWWVAGVFAVAFLFRYAIGLGPYSGFNTPPMFGDYEAQRHWMEITLHLPPSQWYVNGTENDLLYWGLDYPPLTAYHSQLMGRVAGRLSPSWVELRASRGHESPAHKRFMRWSALLPDLLLYFPAAAAAVHRFQLPKGSSADKALLLGLHLLWPGFLLVDHAHFQYNAASLGLALTAALCLLSGWELPAAALFVAALNYKQMELYHALPFFAALLGSSLRRRGWLERLSRLGAVALVTIASFVLLWLPFLDSADSALAVLHRLFPFGRGIYEDKVGNVWCALSVVVKWKRLFSAEAMVRLSLGATVAALLPGLVCGLRSGSGRSFRLHLTTSALSFFLFSFQVHEKSILLAAMPALLMVEEEAEATVWFLATAALSLHPLAAKDGTGLGLAASLLAFAVLSELWLLSPHSPAPQPKGRRAKTAPANHLRVLRRASCALGLLMCLAAETLAPPKALPDLWPLLNAAFSCAHFLAYWALLNVRHFALAFAKRKVH